MKQTFRSILALQTCSSDQLGLNLYRIYLATKGLLPVFLATAIF